MSDDEADESECDSRRLCRWRRDLLLLLDEDEPDEAACDDDEVLDEDP